MRMDKELEMNRVEIQEPADHCHPRLTIRDDVFASRLVSRLNRIEGQVRGIRRMIEEDVYCDDVLHQITAARSALASVSRRVLEDHIHGCLVDRIRAGEDEVVEELLITIGKMIH